MSVTNYIYQTNAEITEIMQSMLPTLRKRSPIFDIFPTVTKDVSTLIWEQRSNYFGMMQVRGLNGAPPTVLNVGFKKFVAFPSYYGEEMPIDETERMERRRAGTFGEPIDVQDLVTERSNYLLHRQLVLEEYLGWQLALNGFYTILNPITQAIAAQDAYVQRISTAFLPWIANPTTSTPLQDIRALKLLHRGYSLDFSNRGGNLWMNQSQFNGMVANRNVNDLYGQRTGGLQAAGMESVLNMESINSILTGEGLPNVGIYDEGYYDVNNVFQLWIPNGQSLLTGTRTDGSRLAQYVYTSNIANAGMAPGPAFKVYETVNTALPNVNVYRGFNGVHQMFYPEGFVLLNC